MNRAILCGSVLAAALVAAAPAVAQRASLADRVAALELRAADNQASVELLNQMNQMRSELQALRAQVEELQHANEQLRSTARTQYLDLDGRLARLEGGASLPAPPPPAASTGGPATATTASTRPGAAASAASERGPSVYGDRGALAQGAGERDAYDAAFARLKAGDYAEAARAFSGFLQQYPGGVYAPNALYWLGESYYATQNYALALQQFQALRERYPTHDKAPGALLKIGLSQVGLKQPDAAERSFNAVLAQYPSTDVARTATGQLDALRLARLR